MGLMANVEYLKLLVKKMIILYLVQKIQQKIIYQKVVYKPKNCSLVECYELDKTAKTKY